jgi:hypothetical protein
MGLSNILKTPRSQLRGHRLREVPQTMRFAVLFRLMQVGRAIIISLDISNV